MDAKFKKTNPLIERMLAAMSLPKVNGGDVFAGYTYLGQLIAHDIVPETNPLTRARTVTPELNFDSLYGQPPYDTLLFNEFGEFVLSEPAAHPVDLPRDMKGQAIIPEPRNDENTIVSQLHLAHMQYHNSLMRELSSSDGFADIAHNFHIAKTKVIKYFQTIVVYDFLWQLLDEGVFASYFLRNDPPLPLFSATPIPAEFSHAAFRFGHSMVRHEYEGFGSTTDERKRSKNTQQLFRQRKALEPAFDINWAQFFPEKLQLPRDDDNINSTNAAMPIDLKFAEAMQFIPIQGGPILNIVEKNLEVAARIGMPTAAMYLRFFSATRTGQDIAERFSLRTLSKNDMRQENAEVIKCGLQPLSPSELYLWPYILLESQTQYSGSRLGVLGSLIIADVISRAIKFSRPTIWSDDTRTFEAEPFGHINTVDESTFASSDGLLNAVGNKDNASLLSTLNSRINLLTHYSKRGHDE